MFVGVNVYAQKKIVQQSAPEKPKLVVGIVIDQMRWDYLYRYQNRYGSGGFKRLMQGFNFEHTLIPYVPTYTAIGHTTVYTGSIPALHGITGNNWYEKSINKNMYCTEDSTVRGVGNNDAAGKMSPKNLWTTTIGDELRLSNNFQSKVIGIAAKDRGAILPAGHSANAAYWLDSKTGNWISSSFYMTDLPEWVKKVNADGKPNELMNQNWETLYPLNTYTLSTADNMPYEGNIPGEKVPTFPHQLSQITKDRYEAFKHTPQCASYTFEFAKVAIAKENLGKGNFTDMLAVSISSTDYMGHKFGPNSIEAEDSYLRLDKDIEDFLLYLDKTIGKNNYTVFLTADHGAAHIPGFLNSHNLPGGTFSNRELMNTLNKKVADSFGVTKAIVNLQNYQLYLNDSEISAKGKTTEEITAYLMKLLKKQPNVTNVFETAKLMQTNLPDQIKSMTANGYNSTRSGDIQFTVRAGYFDGGATGTTHGLWNPYDAHIPLIFYGWGVKAGVSNRTVYMTDIAPTVAALLKIQMPSGNVGNVLIEITDK